MLHNRIIHGHHISEMSSTTIHSSYREKSSNDVGLSSDARPVFFGEDLHVSSKRYRYFVFLALIRCLSCPMRVKRFRTSLSECWGIDLTLKPPLATRLFRSGTVLSFLHKTLNLLSVTCVALRFRSRTVLFRLK